MRLMGVSIPDAKQVWISLTYVYGIGRRRAVEICKRCGITSATKVSELTEQDVLKLSAFISDQYVVGSDLKRKENECLQHLRKLGCYRGVRHRLRLPVRGQRTRTNARTRKGKAVAIAGKKK